MPYHLNKLILDIQDNIWKSLDNSSGVDEFTEGFMGFVLLKL